MESQINELDHWIKQDSSLYRSIKFKNFKEALHAMNLIGEVAEELNHHPNWSNVYSTLEIKLFTHTVKDVTDLDYEFAARINEIIAKHFS